MSPRAAPGCVLLDLDDTLYPERAYFESGLVALGSWLAARDGRAPEDWRRRLVTDVERHGRIGVLDRLTPPPDVSREGWRAALLLAYRTHAPALTLFPDALAFISRAQSAGCRLGLVTDGKSRVQWRKLTALGLERHFDVIVCSDDIDSAKPAPEAFLAAATLLGVPPDACVYVADDASKDFIGPKRLGMATVQVRRSLPFPLARPAPDDSAHAGVEVASLAEAAAVLFGDR